MRRAEYLLTVLQEECGEVVQAAAKIQRFSSGGVGPGESKTNAELLVGELIDVIAMIEMLEREGVISMPSMETIQAMAQRKQAKVESYMRLSVEVGALDPVALRTEKGGRHAA